MELFEKAFEEYISNYDMNVKQIRYKYHHSYKVEGLMEELAKRLNLNDEETYIAKLIGLLHDIGRFEQVRVYKKCSDVKTGVDHADESVKYLFDKGHIRDFIKDDKYDQIIKDAIKNHNKFEIDKKVKYKNLMFSKMIRDMDKVDIFRVLSEEYKYDFDKDTISDKIKEAINNKRTVNTHDIKSSADKVLSYCVFLYDINYKESFEILRETENFKKMFKMVTPINGSEDKLEEIKNYYYKLIEDVK